MADPILAQINAHPGMFYVYVLSRPNGEPFYVGLGSGRRVLDHETAARLKARDYKSNIIRKCWAAGEKIGKRIEAFYPTRQAVAAAERALIAKIGRRDLGAGPLVNLTAGGDGTHELSQEAIARKSVALKQSWNDARRESASLRSRNPTPETRRKMSEARKGIKRGPTGRQKTPRTEEHKKKIAAALTGNPRHCSRRSEVRAKIGAANSGPRPNHHTKRPEWQAQHGGANHPRALPIEISGIRYEAKFLAAAALGVSLATIDRWLKTGRNDARLAA